MRPCMQGSRIILPREKRLFWLALMAMMGHWILAIVIAFFGLSKYILVAVIGILFTAGNLFGYFKCSREAQAEVGGLTCMHACIEECFHCGMRACEFAWCSREARAEVGRDLRGAGMCACKHGWM